MWRQRHGQSPTLTAITYTVDTHTCGDWLSNKHKPALYRHTKEWPWQLRALWGECGKSEVTRQIGYLHHCEWCETSTTQWATSITSLGEKGPSLRDHCLGNGLVSNVEILCLGFKVHRSKNHGKALSATANNGEAAIVSICVKTHAVLMIQIARWTFIYSGKLLKCSHCLWI